MVGSEKEEGCDDEHNAKQEIVEVLVDDCKKNLRAVSQKDFLVFSGADVNYCLAFDGED